MDMLLQFSSIHHHLVSFFRRFMSQPPPNVPGLFIGLQYQLETSAWHDTLRDNASSCKLMRVEFCKTKGGKLHEFLILCFSHPTHTAAQAVAIVDRAAKDSSHTAKIVSPSVSPQNIAEALDKVLVLGQGDNLERYLYKTYKRYHKLCVLHYPSADSNPSSLAPPSAIQLSTLLLVASKHRPNYDLYEHNCYWYADTIFEACKKLFPGCREECNRHGDRGRCQFNLSMLDTHDLPHVCNEYNVAWGRIMQQRTAQQEERRVREEWGRKLEEERRHSEGLERELQEMKRRFEQLQGVTNTEIPVN